LNGVEVLGVRLDALGLGEATRCIDSWIASGTKGFVCLVNVHVVETARKSPELREALRDSGLNLPDGAPVAWLAGRKMGRRIGRVTGSDFFAAVCGGTRRRHFFLGSTEPTLVNLIEAVETCYPRAEICGAHSPPFRTLSGKDSADIAARVNESSPDIVWVGLGAPRQEVWMLRNRDRIDAPVLAGVGAVFDFASGVKRRAPDWVQRSGLEWVHRLASEPRRLSGRYLSTNSSFLTRAAGEELATLCGSRRRPPPTEARR
jgi:N-acetylglucosaminyldiphosphoundecaprenol N-acetyl-beta-D-mannosaminyltransferase